MFLGSSFRELFDPVSNPLQEVLSGSHGGGRAPKLELDCRQFRGGVLQTLLPCRQLIGDGALEEVIAQGKSDKAVDGSGRLVSLSGEGKLAFLKRFNLHGTVGGLAGESLNHLLTVERQMPEGIYGSLFLRIRRKPYGGAGSGARRKMGTSRKLQVVVPSTPTVAVGVYESCPAKNAARKPLKRPYPLRLATRSGTLLNLLGTMLSQSLGTLSK